jgi:uncharacterized protein (TIGR03546 family)
MITRQIGKILRGNATPFQLVAACVLGSLLGFAPGLTKAPALYVLLVAALLVVNANIGLTLLVAGLMKIVSLLVVPVSFKVGRFLLDGPTEGIAHAVVNAPILAWCGFERYVVAGGELIALVLGLSAGLALAGAVMRFRRRMIASRDNPSRMKDLAEKPVARFAIWLLFGSTGKQTWEQKLEKRVGNPVRVWGAALLVVLLVGTWFAQKALAGPFARRAMTVSLEEVNGATVDVGGVELALREGRVAVDGLALADPNELGRDLFRAAKLEADVDQVDVLRKRLHVAKIVVSEAHSGLARETPGEKVATKRGEVADKTREKIEDLGEGEYTLEDVVAQYELWKGRLEQARSWIDRIGGNPAEGEPGDESWSERLEREVRERGWGSITADHLIDEAPMLRLSELVVDGLQATWMDGHTFDVKAFELSSHPALVDAAPRLEVASRDGSIGIVIDLAPVSRKGGDGALRFHWSGLSVDAVMAQLKIPGGSPLTGGTLAVELDGAWDEGRIGHVNLPLRATLRNTVLTMKGIDPTPLDELVLPIGLRGPIDSPRIQFDASALTDALVAAGKKELANRVGKLLEGEVGEKLGELSEKTGIEVPKDMVDLGDLGKVGEKLPEGATKGAKDALDGLFGKKKKDGDEKKD